MHVKNTQPKIIHIAGKSIAPDQIVRIPDEHIEGVRESGLFRAGHLCAVTERGEGQVMKPITAFSAVEALKAVNGITSVRDLEDCLEEEETSPTARKTVLAAIKSRLEALASESPPKG